MQIAFPSRANPPRFTPDPSPFGAPRFEVIGPGPPPKNARMNPPGFFGCRQPAHAHLVGEKITALCRSGSTIAGARSAVRTWPRATETRQSRSWARLGLRELRQRRDSRDGTTCYRSAVSSRRRIGNAGVCGLSLLLAALPQTHVSAAVAPESIEIGGPEDSDPSAIEVGDQVAGVDDDRKHDDEPPDDVELEDDDAGPPDDVAATDAGLSAAPPAKPCRRRDFDSFDAFVDCKATAEGVDKKAPPTASPAAAVDRRSPLERAERAEYSEALASMETSKEKRARDERQYVLGRKRLSLGLGLGGGALMLGGTASIIASIVLGTETRSSDSGPMCTVGKRCGDTCIEVADTCHVGARSGATRKPKPVALWTGIALLAAGTALFGVALSILLRIPATTGRGVVRLQSVGPHGVALAF